MGVIRSFLALLIAASTASAATFIVGDDRDLVRSSSAVVIATAVESHAIRSPHGTIETVTRLRADDVISGPLARGDEFDVITLGGSIDGFTAIIPGSPRFAAGARALLFLDVGGAGFWTPRAMALGKFSFSADANGRELLARDEKEIFGWDRDGSPHVERPRDAAEFLRFVRETAAGGDPPANYFVDFDSSAKRELAPNSTPPASTYLMQQGGMGVRWNGFPTPVVFFIRGSQPGARNGGLTSAQIGLAVWTNDSGSNINYQLGGSTSTGGFLTNDGAHTILFNDPNNDIPGSFTGGGGGGDVLAVGGVLTGSATHSFGGETFLTALDSDLVVQDGIDPRSNPGVAGNGFDHVIAHELGHTLGFRHSDDPPPGGTSTTNALMYAYVNFNADPTGAALQDWDRQAAAAVYGAGGPTCTAPSITRQPQSVDFTGADVALSVEAAGTGPLHYQWYVGSTGDTRQVVPNGNSPGVSVRPSSTTSYWVRVSGACAPPADSQAAVVTVNGCPGVSIGSISGTATIIEGHSTAVAITISSAGRPVTIQWYEGERGDTSHPIRPGNTATINVSPAVTQSYWAQVTNDCGAVATSDAVTIIVKPCNTPLVLIDPTGGEVIRGTTASLSAVVSGTQPMQCQWYEGATNDTSHPVIGASSASAVTSPLLESSKFWLMATNDCGSISTRAISIDVVAVCTAPLLAQPHDQIVPAGATTVVRVVATGPSLTYTWYQGPVFDFTKPVGNGPAIATGPIRSVMQYWVSVTNPCGNTRSGTITISPGDRRRAAGGR